MTASHAVGWAIVLLLITAAGLYSGRRVKTAGDFTTGGGRGGVGIVAGVITGTLIGGGSTIGTAQLAVVKGFSAWWFTLGGGLGCILMALLFVNPIRNAKSPTLSGMFADEYGRRAGFLSILLMSMGNLLTIVSQILSGVALITSVVPVGPVPAACAVVLLMLAYVAFGGIWGAGMVGMVKLFLLCGSIILCGSVALERSGGVGALYSQLPHADYFNLFARGVSVDLGAGLSLIIGVLTTQTYIQAIFSARSAGAARLGTLLSGVVMPPLGVLSIFVGMHVRLSHPEWGSSSALPAFADAYLPPVLSGMILATLLVTLVGTGAGMALGVSSMFCRDVYRAYIRPNGGGADELLVSRLGIVVVLGVALLFTMGDMGSMILDWNFLAMGLRGAVASAPMCFALFLPGRIDRRFAEIAMIAGPVFVILGRLLFPGGIDPLFYGVSASAAAMLLGLRFRR